MTVTFTTMMKCSKDIPHTHAGSEYCQEPADIGRNTLHTCHTTAYIPSYTCILCKYGYTHTHTLCMYEKGGQL